MSIFNVLVDVNSGRPDALALEECHSYRVQVGRDQFTSGAGWSFVISPSNPGDDGVEEADMRPVAGMLYSGMGAFAGWYKINGRFSARVNRMMVFVHRFVGDAAGVTAGQVPVRVTLKRDERSRCEFTTNVPLGLAFPGSFDYTFVETAVEDFCLPHDPPVHPTPCTEGVPGDVVLHSDEVLGDVASSVSGFPTGGESPRIGSEMPAPLRNIPAPPDLGRYADAAIARPSSGNAKLKWLAGMFGSLVDVGWGDVLVGGDHPGTFARALADAGHDVTGVDPRNTRSVRRANATFGSGLYEAVPGRLSVNTALEDWGAAWGGVFMDIGVSENSAESDTAVNLGLVDAFLGAGVPIGMGKARSAPRVPGVWTILDNPGWEVRGCETYLLRGTSHDPPTGSFALGAVRVDDSAPDLAVKVYDDYWVDLCKLFFSLGDDGWFRVPYGSWYHFVNLRTLVFAKRRNETELGHRIMSARSGIDVWFALRDSFACVDDRVRSDAAARFRSDVTVNARGVSRTMLERVPGMMDTMAARYRTLLALCSDPGAECPHDLGLIMKHPGSGALLADLSQLRTLMDEDQPALAEYSRVLPWGSMSILCSEMFFRLVYWYVLLTGRAYKVPHAWELQHVLWNLSSFGTDAERFLFFFDAFSRIFGGVDQARGFSRRGTAAERCFRTFDENLSLLGVRDAYLDFDRAFSLLVARRARPSRGRTVTQSVRAGTDGGSTRRSTVATRSVAADLGGGAITDLADFGVQQAWDSETDLHTVLNAVRGRVDPQRAYTYWCCLSHVERPPGTARARWRPRINLLSAEALAFKLPGLDNAKSFVTLRDNHLRSML
ncbi:hypothetical protein 1 [Cordyceps chanhua alternavirus 1]|uniref:Uncharacterized protein n=1 Tax=Cordyceps chanhua alternavirus 1 TaxID=2936613 RepID=A0A8U0LTU6_9VIRU|nr:hypothetical protein 1 [Cordyceps chanhua alternavirus 1]UPH33985.1 hypothetical protein 1 [Cordyceps chanhua alternavirus 1]